MSARTETDAQQRALRYQIEYSYNILSEHYFEYLIEELENDIQNSDRENIIKKTGMVVSNCASRGWSTLALHNIIEILYNSKNNMGKWDVFKNRLLSSGLENYYVYIPLKLKLKITRSQSKTTAMEKVHDEIKDMGLELKTQQDIVSENSVLGSIMLKIYISTF